MSKYHTTDINRNTFNNMDRLLSNFNIHIIDICELPQNIDVMTVILNQQTCIYIKQDLSIRDRKKKIVEELKRYLNHKKMVDIKKEIHKRVK